MRLRNVARLVGVLLVFSISGFSQQVSQNSQPKKALSNQDIVSMTNIKFSDATILKAIQVNDTDFDLSAGALVALKSAGVSQPVIDAMLATAGTKKGVMTNGSRQPTAEVVDSKTDLMAEVGIYAVQGNKLVSMEPEIVNWRTGGVLKTMATAGLDKGHVNGTVSGPSSKFDLASPSMLTPQGMVFYIHCLEGGSAAEYQLLRLWRKENRREFRAVTGGVLHASGGAQTRTSQ